ncbi:MAG: O-acetylhomoserine aminocarboxypropyltransferase/cysteine synthase family protein [Verrucomicrobiota bacterium]|nr:O-acetylhomoserine aminocarboxypropyltransferase/cysteine synthase family protein [Verrucomicrobiota bacterium]
MSKYGNSTISLHAGQSADPTTGARAVPIYQTSSYVFNSSEHAANLFALKEFGNIYTRLMNPTTDVLEKRIASLEGGTGALATSSGMAAIFLAVTNIAKAGDHIVSSASLYGGTQTLFLHTLPRFGIEVTFLEDFTPKTIENAIKKNTKLVYGETIGNPKGDVPDIKRIADVAHSNGLPFFIDNTFAPILCKPIDHGVDIVIHSCTKWIGGHGTSIGGVIVDSGNFDWSQGRFDEFTTPDSSYHGVVYWDTLGNVPEVGNIAFIVKARVQGMRNIGPCPSPMNEFLLLQGIETLPLRIKKHAENTLELANHLKENSLVEWVNYLGLEEHHWHSTASEYFSGGYGSVFGFGIKGGHKTALKFIDSVKLASHLANVGDAKTLVIHPASTTHQQLNEKAKKAAGISEEFIRVSVGLEDIADIIEDFEQALKASQE